MKLKREIASTSLHRQGKSWYKFNLIAITSRSYSHKVWKMAPQFSWKTIQLKFFLFSLEFIWFFFVTTSGLLCQTFWQTHHCSVWGRRQAASRKFRQVNPQQRDSLQRDLWQFASVESTQLTVSLKCFRILRRKSRVCRGRRRLGHQGLFVMHRRVPQLYCNLSRSIDLVQIWLS